MSEYVLSELTATSRALHSGGPQPNAPPPLAGGVTISSETTQRATLHASGDNKLSTEMHSAGTLPSSGCKGGARSNDGRRRVNRHISGQAAKRRGIDALMQGFALGGLTSLGSLNG
jgi:hypothetical protein